jgi:hypothetical protein
VALKQQGCALVQMLHTDARVVAEARKKLQAAGVYGDVSAVVFDGKITCFR